MRTCPACGRQYADEVTVCPSDGEPLGAVTVTGPTKAGEVEEETVVRPKRAQPLPSPRFSEVRIGAPEPAVAGVGEVRRTEVPDRVYRERSPWPAVAVAAVVFALGITAVIYYTMAGETDLSKEVGTQLTDARVAVADARARLESLPQDSPLRSKLLSLQQWDRELQNLELAHDRTREVASRAREIAGLARSIGEEARVAGATVPAAPPVVQPATPAPPGPGEQPATDPMSGKPPEPAPAATAPVKPPEVQTAPTGVPGDAKAPAPEGTNAAQPPKLKVPDAAPNENVAPPPPPPAPEEKKPSGE
jgi:hypothetical protein